MATAQRTRSRAVVGAPRRAAWQLKLALPHSVSAAPRTKIFYIFFTVRLNFCEEVRYAFFVVVWVRYVGTARFFVMVRVRYVDTLFELKISDFSNIAPAICMQRQKRAEADAKCVN